MPMDHDYRHVFTFRIHANSFSRHAYGFINMPIVSEIMTIGMYLHLECAYSFIRHAHRSINMHAYSFRNLDNRYIYTF